MAKSFFNLIFSIPGVKPVVGSILFMSFFGFVFKLFLNYSSSHWNVWTVNATNDWIVSSFLISFLFFPFFSIGKKIFNYLFVVAIMCLIFYAISSSLNHFVLKIKIQDTKIFTYSYMLAFSLPILKMIISFLNRNKKSDLNKTMSEIDNFGIDENGKKQSKLAGDLFERYIRDLYRAQGYDAHVAFDLKAQGKAPEGLQNLSGDGGCDVVAEDKKTGVRLIIQCKHYSNSVGVEACYQASGALNNYQGTHAIVITNNFFTEEAKFTAKNNNITLIDRFGLTKMISEVCKLQESKQTVTGKNLYKNKAA